MRGIGVHCHSPRSVERKDDALLPAGSGLEGEFGDEPAMPRVYPVEKTHSSHERHPVQCPLELFRGGNNLHKGERGVSV